MSYALLTLEQVTAMLCIAVITVIIYKLGLIQKESSKSFSNLLLMVVNPVLLFQSFQQEFTQERLIGLGVTLVLSFISFGVMILITNLMVPEKEGRETDIERFGCIYSNCGFVGIPLVQAVFGSEGVFYLSAFMIIFNIMVWTHGLILMTGKNDIRQLMTFVKSPIFVAIILGTIRFFTQIQLPKVANQVVDLIANMNTPLAMIVAGMAVADANLLTILKKRRIYYISMIRLLIIPILFTIVTSFLPIPFLIKATIAIAWACPTATTGTMFAIRYDKDAQYMAEIFSVTTILSIITIPFVIYLIQTL